MCLHGVLKKLVSSLVCVRQLTQSGVHKLLYWGSVSMVDGRGFLEDCSDSLCGIFQTSPTRE